MLPPDEVTTASPPPSRAKIAKKWFHRKLDNQAQVNNKESRFTDQNADHTVRPVCPAHGVVVQRPVGLVRRTSLRILLQGAEGGCHVTQFSHTDGVIKATNRVELQNWSQSSRSDVGGCAKGYSTTDIHCAVFMHVDVSYMDRLC